MMKSIRSITQWLGVACLTVAILGFGQAVSAAYPEKPIKIVVPYGAGGSSDIVARTIVNRINELKLLPQPLVVVNVEGGAGAVGFQRVKDANPDGYEILVNHIGLLVGGAIGRVPFGPEAFDVYAQTGSVKLVFVVKDGGEYNSFEDVVAGAKAKPGEVPTASSIGGSVHLAGLLVSKAAGVKFRIVHVGGGSKRIKSVLGDHTGHSFFSTAEYKSYKDSGVKAVMMVGAERHPDFPDIPSSKDLGYDVDFGIDYWWFAPKGTPADRLAMLEEVWGKALKDEALLQALRDKGVAPNFLSGADARTRIDATYADVKSFAGDLKKK